MEGSRRGRYREPRPGTKRRRSGCTFDDCRFGGSRVQRLDLDQSRNKSTHTRMKGKEVRERGEIPNVCAGRGDIHDGVPHRVVVKDSSPITFARPKSASFTERSLSARSMFSGLMSRWTMFLSCWQSISFARHRQCLLPVKRPKPKTHQILDPLKQLDEQLPRLLLTQLLLHHNAVE